jgi:hypothetical protein
MTPEELAPFADAFVTLARTRAVNGRLDSLLVTETLGTFRYTWPLLNMTKMRAAVKARGVRYSLAKGRITIL